jgi:flagellar motor protein MotB
MAAQGDEMRGVPGGAAAGGAPEVASAAGATEALVVALATELARDGRRAEAEELVRELPEPAGPVRSDLLARLRAQDGDLDGAERHWRQVPAGDELAPAAQAGLRRIEILRRRPGWLRFNLMFGLTVLALCAAATATVAGGVVALSSGDAATAPPSGHATAALSDALAPTPPSPTPSPSPVATQTPAAPTVAQVPPDVNLAVSGASVRPRGDALVVTFDRGLFRAGQATLSAAGADALGRVAGRLRVGGVPLGVRVVGHTDDVPPHAGGPYPTNAALGYARAAAAAALLQRASGLPLSAVSAASVGSAGPVGDNHTAAGRQRNRTVVLEVWSR